jgi:3'-phosphoadenosine 5'-phosphosulfate sulfotransferase (PAPS reductase)/FAD synthetase
MEEIHALIARGALFVANHSGGKDSMAMLNRLARIVPREQLLVVHASLGEAEWAGALDKAEHHADALGVRFIVARARKTLFGMVEHRKRVRPDAPSWPSAANRQCTSDLKRGPIQREVRRFTKAEGFTSIVNCVGIRAQESSSRAKAIPFRRDERNSVAGRDWFDWLPIHDLSTAKVWAEIEAGPLRPHHAYALGNERLSCVFCIMGSRNDLANGARHHPELFARYREMESRTGYTMHQSRKSLAEIVEAA